MTVPRPTRRLGRPAVGIAVVVGLGLGPQCLRRRRHGLARQACAHVNRSIALLKQAEPPVRPDPSAPALEQQAYDQLRPRSPSPPRPPTTTASGRR